MLLLVTAAVLSAARDRQTDAAAQAGAPAFANTPAVLAGGVGGRTGWHAGRSRTSARIGSATAFAAVDGLMLHLPHDAPHVVAFHEASRAGALEMSPVGLVLGNGNPTRFTAPPSSDGAGYHVLASRGRALPATSAVDIVIPRGAPILAPVSGTVVEVAPYELYGSIDDYRVVIEPDTHSGLAVVLIHLDDPLVQKGDRVRHRFTRLGSVRQLPLDSQVDALMGRRSAHVHMEVKAAHGPASVNAHQPVVEPTRTS